MVFQTLIANTILAESGPFTVWGGNTYLEEKIFIFIICLKRNFLSTTKFWEVQKYFGVTAPERPTVSAGLGTVARKSSIRGLHVCAGGARHSENVF